jgi:hypothetical protein
LRIVPPNHLPRAVPASAFLRAVDRDQLAADRADVFIVASTIDYDGPYGAQALYWLRGPWGEEEKVLALTATDFRRSEVGAFRSELRRSDAIGPFKLTRRATATSGHKAWAFVNPATQADQLALDTEDRDS